MDTADLETEEVSDFPFPSVDDMAEVAFRLHEDDLEQLKQQAERRDIHHETLIRFIVQAHLSNPLTYAAPRQQSQRKAPLDSD